MLNFFNTHLPIFFKFYILMEQLNLLSLWKETVCLVGCGAKLDKIRQNSKKLCLYTPN